MNIFTHATDIELPGVTYSSSAFFDYDNDGDLDIFISGDGSGYISKLFKNTGGSFSEDTGSTFDGVYHGSSAFGDYDNDGDIDILITGLNGGTKISKLYKNTEGVFSEYTESTLTGVQYSSAAFGDYDNDGDLDILITGDTGSSKIMKLYQNTEGSFIEYTDTTFPDFYRASTSFGDYDNDGDLDILVTGNSSGRATKLYKYSDGIFNEDSSHSITGFEFSSASFGDYDNDGDLDILLVGSSDFGKKVKLYKNTGGSFTEDTGSTFTGVQDCSASFGDYDSDGDLDIIIAGDTGSELIAKVYKNTDSIFSEDSTLLGIRYCSVSFGDYDNDGDLDILMTGEANGVKTARVYKNNINTPNTLPSEPDSLTAMVTGQHIQLSWSAGSDAETLSSTGLNYNLRIGSYPGGNDVLSPMALPLSSGYRLIPERGMYQNLTTTVNLPDGKYYWSVQAIDTAFAGSEFTAEDYFSIGEPEILSSNFGFSKRVMWMSVFVSDCHPELEKPKLDDNIIHFQSKHCRRHHH